MTNQSKWRQSEFDVKDLEGVNTLIGRSIENRAVAKT